MPSGALRDAEIAMCGQSYDRKPIAPWELGGLVSRHRFGGPSHSVE